jgi:hypothetical protein
MSPTDYCVLASDAVYFSTFEIDSVKFFLQAGRSGSFKSIQLSAQLHGITFQNGHLKITDK